MVRCRFDPYFDDPQNEAEGEFSLMPDGKILTRCVSCGKSAEGNVIPAESGYYDLTCQHCGNRVSFAAYDRTKVVRKPLPRLSRQ